VGQLTTLQHVAEISAEFLVVLTRIAKDGFVLAQQLGI
jgi:hypothetical protein